MKNLILFLSLLFLTACGNQTVVTEQVPVLPDDDMLIECVSTAPPNKLVFMSSSVEERLFLMTKSYNEQTKNIENCNIQLQVLRNWKLKMQEIYTKYKKVE